MAGCKVLFYQGLPALPILFRARVHPRNHRFQLISEFDIYKDVFGQIYDTRHIRWEKIQETLLELCILKLHYFIHHKVFNSCSNCCHRANSLLHHNTIQVLKHLWEQTTNVCNHQFLLTCFLSSGPKVGCSLIMVHLIAGGLIRS